MWECGYVKQEEVEVGVSLSAGLYAKHEIKQELVVGPEVLQPPDVAFALQADAELVSVKEENDAEADSFKGSYASSECSGEYLKEVHVFTESYGEQLGLKPCTVRIERLLVDKSKKTGYKALDYNLNQIVKRIHKAEEIDNLEVNNKVKVEGRFSCDNCGASFKIKQKIIRHLQSCLKPMVTSNVARRKNKPTKSSSCNICKKKFTTQQSLIIHQVVHTGLKPYKCGVCKKGFTQKSHVSRHKMTHFPRLEPTHYACEMCNKKFRTNYDLRAHMRMHTGQMPYLCQICGKLFNRMYILKEHLQRHTGLKVKDLKVTVTAVTKPRCDICNKEYASKWNLNKHKRSHTGETPYMCSICEKKFAHKHTLKKHTRIHSGEKVSCNICRKELTDKFTLVAHKRLHTGERPFSCDFCDKRFASNSALTNHKYGHKENLLSCDICDKQYTHITSLRNHKQTHK